MRKGFLWILLWICLFSISAVGLAEEDQVAIVFTESGPVWDGGNITWSQQVMTIIGEGVYSLSGSCSPGRIVVEAGKKGNVTLILNGFSVETISGYALEIASANTVTIHPAEGTENRIAALSEGDGAFSAIYSKGDVILTGTGTMELISSGKHGIQSADGITIQDGNISVHAAGNGFRAHDFIRVNAGQIEIVSGGDGIRISGDEQKPESGWIEIHGGQLSIQSEQDGIQAETTALITNGSLNIKAGGGADNTTVHEESWSRWQDEEEEGTDSISRKGIKAQGTLTISGGEITINAADDAIHSNNAVSISGSRLILQSGDDGVHADYNLTVSGGVIQIEQSYEGLEANQILISSGDISVFARNDGLNAYGGTNAWGWGRPSSASDDKPTDMPKLIIEGGNIYVNAEGDGLDSNGHIDVRGGQIVVDGPSRSMNGALDSGAENGGELTISEGTILAIGASGMAEVFDGSSAQCSFCYNGLSFSAGDWIRVADAQGTVLIEHQAAKSGDSVVFSAPSLSVGDRLLLTVGSVTENIELTETTTSYGDSGWGNWW